MKNKQGRRLALILLLWTVFSHTPVYAEEKPLQAQLPGKESVLEAQLPSKVYTGTEIAAPTATATTSPPSATEPEKPKIILYPIEVQEFVTDGNRQVVKIYELADDEKPENIDTAAFERNGWRYTLMDVIKKETAAADVREHTETVTKNTSTRDMDTILKQLEPTMDMSTEDGYSGVLQLDISSIVCETAGYKNNSYTVTATREYPHLSQNDTSLIPKTVSENGATLTLSGVTWQAQNNTAVDYNSIPDSYKAIAKYTTTVTKTSVTGYVTTATYRGSISKMLKGKTVYAVYFSGKEIAPPTPTPPPPPVEEEAPFNPLPIAATTTTATGLIGGFVFFFFIRRNVKVFNLKDGKFTPIGKVLVSYKNPVIDLTKFTEIAATGNFIIVLNKAAAKKLNGKMVTVNYGEKSFQHIVDGGDSEYEFEVDF